MGSPVGIGYHKKSVKDKMPKILSVGAQPGLLCALSVVVSRRQIKAAAAANNTKEFGPEYGTEHQPHLEQGEGQASAAVRQSAAVTRISCGGRLCTWCLTSIRCSSRPGGKRWRLYVILHPSSIGLRPVTKCTVSDRGSFLVLTAGTASLHERVQDACLFCGIHRGRTIF